MSKTPSAARQGLDRTPAVRARRERRKKSDDDERAPRHRSFSSFSSRTHGGRTVAKPSLAARGGLDRTPAVRARRERRKKSDAVGRAHRRDARAARARHARVTTLSALIVIAFFSSSSSRAHGGRTVETVPRREARSRDRTPAVRARRERRGENDDVGRAHRRDALMTRER